MTAEEVKAARRELGLSVREFGALLGIADARGVRRWEDGTYTVPGSAALLIQCALQFPAVRDWLIKRAGIATGTPDATALD